MTDPQTKAAVTAMLQATEGALSGALEALYVLHGDQLGQWLDDLEAAAIKGALSRTNPALPVSEELQGLQIVVPRLTKVFSDFRAGHPIFSDAAVRPTPLGAKEKPPSGGAEFTSQTCSHK